MPDESGFEVIPSQASSQIDQVLFNYFWAIIIVLGGGTVVAAMCIASAAVRLLTNKFGM